MKEQLDIPSRATRIRCSIVITLLLSISLITSHSATAQEKQRKYISALELSGSSGYVAKSSDFLSGDNLSGEPVHASSTINLKYTLEPQKGSWQDLVYGAPYRGIGLSYGTFYNPEEIGQPWSLYFLQGGRLLHISPWVNFNYEWNAGLSFGWRPYDKLTNPYNTAIGGRVNAYIGLATYFHFIISRHLGLNLGVSFAHYSDGNTTLPNEGLNHAMLTFGVKYKINPEKVATQKIDFSQISPFPRYMEYELMGYASWKGVVVDTTGSSLDDPYLNKKFFVAGISFAPLYNLSYRFRVGGSLDVNYCESDGMSYNIVASRLTYERASLGEQFSIGLAARADYVMPYFTIAATVGYDLLHANSDTSPLYQTIALKVNLSQDIFLNFGYRVNNFKNPDFLNIGVGLKFSKYR